MKTWDTIIVGTGSAGIAAAEEFARADDDRSVLLLTDEDRYPYKRTKISKNIARSFDRDAFLSKIPEWYSDAGIDVRINVRVSEIDTKRRRVLTTEAERFGFRTLILAPGATPRRPVDLEGAHVVRTIADVEGLQRTVSPGESVLVAGVGVLGVEVTEQLSKLGLRITAVGAGAHVMEEELNEYASGVMRRHFEESGIDLRLEQRVTDGRRERNGRYTIGLEAGPVTVDHLVLCAGIDPSIMLAERSGIAVGHGILVDEMLRTNADGMYAAGDAAEHPNGEITHLWHAAEHQGRIAAWNTLGHDVEHSCPAFRLKCEVFDRYFFSLNNPSRHELERHDITEERGTPYRCFYYSNEVLQGVVMIDDRDRAKEYERAVREGWSRSEVESGLAADAHY